MNEFTPPDFEKWGAAISAMREIYSTKLHKDITEALQQAYLQGYTKGCIDTKSEIQAKAFNQD